MPTSSIFKNIELKTKEEVENFIDTVESSKKFVEIKNCTKCEHFKEDLIMEDYICEADKNEFTQYIGETLWQIEGSSKQRKCPLK
jgi:hypothetical protein